MYHIDSKTDKPDIEYLYNEAKRAAKRGIRLNNISDLMSRFVQLRDELYADFAAKYGVLNPNSSQQLTRFIQGMSNKALEVGDSTIYEACYVGGKWTTNKEAMTKLSEIGYEFATDLLVYRTAKKYAETLVSMSKFADKDGLVKPDVDLGKTNRVQYKNPGLLTIPKRMLWNTIAPFNEGDKLYSVDIKNQEPSILINMLGNDELKGALEHDGGLYEYLFRRIYKPKTKLTIMVHQLDVTPRIIPNSEMSVCDNIPPAMYSPIRPQSKMVKFGGKQVKLINVCTTLAKIGGKVILPDEAEILLEDNTVEKVPVIWNSVKDSYKKAGLYEVDGDLQGLTVECLPDERADFKRGWLALSYGAQLPGLREMCKEINPDVLYNYCSNIKEFQEYRKYCGKMSRENKQVVKTYFGTAVRANEYDSSSRLKRILMDLPIQGTGADILSLLMKHFNEVVNNQGLDGKLWIYFTRHDELVVEVAKEWFDEVGEGYVEAFLKDCLEHQIDDWTPFKVEIGQVKETDGVELLLESMREEE